MRQQVRKEGDQVGAAITPSEELWVLETRVVMVEAMRNGLMWDVF